jgi:hypothetical protein
MPPATDPDGPAALLNPMLVALSRSNIFAHTPLEPTVMSAFRSSLSMRTGTDVPQMSEKQLKSSLSLQGLTNQGLPFLANEVAR